MYRSSSDSYLFTTNYTEARYAYESQNYNPQTSPGFVAPELTKCRCDLIPVYRVDRADPKEDHFFTTSKDEAQNAVKNLGYADNGIGYYCAAKLGDCGATLAYHRYRRNNAQQNHFYTTDKDEGKKIVTSVGGTYENILCYIWQSSL